MTRAAVLAGEVRTTTHLPDVAQLVHEVRELAARVAVLERDHRRLSRTDHLALSRLLPVIVGRYGSEVFTARDVVEDAAPAIRLIVGQRSAKGLGRLFARAADAGPVDGLLVERAARQVNVTGWRIVGASVSSH